MMGEGIKTLEPGGNQIIRRQSHDIRSPPSSGSKEPRDVIAHHPQARFAKLR
jgi:hypothetical protein